jgi:phosphoserine aminotransferase
MSNRSYNFGAGPCTLPLEALEEARDEFLDFQNTGMSVIELSHRSKEYDSVHCETIDLIKSIYKTPDEFDVVFIQGGATMQFSLIPMNLLHPGQKAAFSACGAWANKALKEASIFGEAYAAWDGTDKKYSIMPGAKDYKLQDNTRYLHITSNETIDGVRMIEWPDVEVPLVGDMSSDFLTRDIPWEKFDLIYGGAQKNCGPSGLAIVFIRKSILETTRKDIGSYFRYDLHQKNNSLLNTPAIFPIYLMNKVLKWVNRNGGLQGMGNMADEKAQLIYDTIDKHSDYYNCPVETKYRSVMNIVFRLPTEALESKFITEATQNRIIGLKGHRNVGGCRASCYNAMSFEGVKALCSFMESFKNSNPN